MRHPPAAAAHMRCPVEPQLTSPGPCPSNLRSRLSRRAFSASHTMQMHPPALIRLQPLLNSPNWASGRKPSRASDQNTEDARRGERSDILCSASCARPSTSRGLRSLPPRKPSRHTQPHMYACTHGGDKGNFPVILRSSSDSSSRAIRAKGQTEEAGGALTGDFCHILHGSVAQECNPSGQGKWERGAEG